MGGSLGMWFVQLTSARSTPTAISILMQEEEREVALGPVARCGHTCRASEFQWMQVAADG